ncbi:MAG: GreA/GreB family elongation factor [Candidatus Eremiobacteraeota bacterium]|nr:GreA/GreB family elongation factor [Candidatus Eremiobacteraeota bacterium]MBC5802986.1 GreA/GreB family elongation factor [Candidatus Eremiobacteraeota bacterium]MBC5822907.1 GreA/GreB family elongation factor [Candidatus Eremiobacteraeota bacterium]
MSRAFVKERDDNEPEHAIPLEREPPHLVTVGGLEQLRAAALRSSGAERARLERRVASAVVASPPDDTGVIAFGATVDVRDSKGKQRTYTLVGEDEVDVAHGRVGEVSPLAQALLGHRVADVVVWQRPVGDEALTILAIGYGALRPA